LALPPAFAYAADVVRIDVLSNRADLISGGDALVAVAIPAGANASAMRVTVGKRDVTAAFAVRADGRYLGRIEGLAPGPNVVTGEAPRWPRARASPSPTIPAAGRCSAARKVQPWSCNPGASDALLYGRAPSYQYFYVRRHRPAGDAGTHRRAWDVGCVLPALRPGQSSARCVDRADHDRSGTYGFRYRGPRI